MRQVSQLFCKAFQDIQLSIGGWRVDVIAMRHVTRHMSYDKIIYPAHDFMTLRWYSDDPL